jgi:hypothetical protein
VTAVFNYDRSIANFIDELSKTGHVTHTEYRKTSVTFHHNGGRLSLQGILDVWKVRPASAQFQVDGKGAVGQYVKLNEYAWGCGNTKGNKESIHIELANATLGPDWTVAEITWKEGARLCGAIHAKVLGVRPTRKTVKMHQDWKNTTCPGPFIKARLNQIIAESQKWYDYFTTPQPAKPADNTNQEDDEMSAKELEELKSYIDDKFDEFGAAIKRQFGEPAVKNPESWLNKGIMARIDMNQDRDLRELVQELRNQPSEPPADYVPTSPTIGK